MAKAHAEFVVACFVVSSCWEDMNEDNRQLFYLESVSRFGFDVIRQTVDELVNVGKTFNVVDYCREQLPAV